MLSCERVVDIDLFNVNGSRFAYCNSCQACTKTNSTDGNHLMPVFWNRLRVKRGSLLLTGIQENDDGRTIKVKVHMQTPRRDNGTNMDYTLTIFVNSSRGSPGNCSNYIYFLYLKGTFEYTTDEKKQTVLYSFYYAVCIDSVRAYTQYKSYILETFFTMKG